MGREQSKRVCELRDLRTGEGYNEGEGTRLSGVTESVYAMQTKGVEAKK